MMIQVKQEPRIDIEDLLKSAIQQGVSDKESEH